MVGTNEDCVWEASKRTKERNEGYSVMVSMCSHTIQYIGIYDQMKLVN